MYNNSNQEHGREIPVHVPLSCPQFLREYNTIPLLCSEVKIKTKDINTTDKESNSMSKIM